MCATGRRRKEQNTKFREQTKRRAHDEPKLMKELKFEFLILVFELTLF